MGDHGADFRKHELLDTIMANLIEFYGTNEVILAFLNNDSILRMMEANDYTISKCETTSNEKSSVTKFQDFTVVVEPMPPFWLRNGGMEAKIARSRGKLEDIKRILVNNIHYNPPVFGERVWFEIR